MVEDGNELGTAESWGRAEEEEKSSDGAGSWEEEGDKAAWTPAATNSGGGPATAGIRPQRQSGWPRQKRGRGGGATAKEEMKREGRGGRRWRRWTRQRRQWLATEEGGGGDGGHGKVQWRRGREGRRSLAQEAAATARFSGGCRRGGGKRRVGQEQGDDGGFPNSGDGKADDEGGWRRRNGIRWRNRREKERMKPTRM